MARAITVVELVVAMSLLAVVSVATTELMVTVKRSQRQREHRAMAMQELQNLANRLMQADYASLRTTSESISISEHCRAELPSVKLRSTITSLDETDLESCRIDLAIDWVESNQLIPAQQSLSLWRSSLK